MITRVAREINAWWRHDPSERYWLEITDRADLGTDLFAPQADYRGRPYWSYNLVTAVQADDVVLHWHKNLAGVPAIVSWSIASGVPEQATIVWQARGTVGRRTVRREAEPAWRMPLREFTPLLAPVTQDELRRDEPQLRAVYQDLAERHTGPLYFPFAFSDKRPVRAAQGYLVKMPAHVIDVFRELALVPRANQLRLPSTPVDPAVEGSPSIPAALAGQRYMNDPRVRRAVERHAVLRATAYFAELGYDVSDVGNVESFDLLVRDAREERRIEVKGSTGVVSAVELTTAEVSNANTYAPTDLFVVDQIGWRREPDGSVATDGGRERVYHNWTPETDALTATRYRYQLPE
jgi:hypothetical protein